MPQDDRENRYVRVKDRAGNDFFCPLDALKNPKDERKNYRIVLMMRQLGDMLVTLKLLSKCHTAIWIHFF